MEYHQRIVKSNARWVWAGMPNCPDGLVPNGQLVCKSNDRIRLDHEYIYQLFDGGASISDVLNQYQTSRTAIEYIHTKWKNNLPAKIAKQPLDRQAILNDLRAGLPAQEIATKHQTTRTSVYNIQKRYQSA
jgi:Mor family transcriptional regulator